MRLTLTIIGNTAEIQVHPKDTFGVLFGFVQYEAQVPIVSHVKNTLYGKYRAEI